MRLWDQVARNLLAKTALETAFGPTGGAGARVVSVLPENDLLDLELYPEFYDAVWRQIEELHGRLRAPREEREILGLPERQVAA